MHLNGLLVSLEYCSSAENVELCFIARFTGRIFHLILLYVLLHGLQQL